MLGSATASAVAQLKELQVAMKAIERYIDARGSVEGKVVASALAALLAFSVFTPTALAVADETEGDGAFDVSDKPAQVEGDTSGAATPLPDTAGAESVEGAGLVLVTEAEHAAILVDERELSAEEAIDREDFSFAVQPEEGFEVTAVTYNDEPLEVAMTRRAVSDDLSGEETSSMPVYLIVAEDLVDGGILKVATQPRASHVEEGTSDVNEPADASAVEGPEEEGNTPEQEEAPDQSVVSSDEASDAPEKPANVAEAVQSAIVKSVMTVADESVRTVQAPLLSRDEGAPTRTVTAALYRGGRYLGTRSVSVPVTGEAVDVSQLLPVSEPVFKIAGEEGSYVLNGKVGVLAGDVQDDKTALSQECNKKEQCVTQLRATDGVVEYCLGGAWKALNDDECLAYFCSKLQNTGEDKGVINVAVEEETLAGPVEGGHTVQLFVFAEASDQADGPALLMQKDLHFGPTVTGIPQGIRLDLGDGVDYQIDEGQCYISNEETGGKSEPYTEAEARLVSQSIGNDWYDGRAIVFGNQPYLALVAYVMPRTYTVTYDANGATGTVPEPLVCEAGAGGSTVTVAAEGDLVREGCHFNGWQAMDAAGNVLGVYQPGDEFSMPACNVTLKALWQDWDGENYYLANYVWVDADGKQELLDTVRVTTGNEGTQLKLGDTVSAKAEDCPAGYDCGAAAPAEFKRLGQVVVFKCEKKKYAVTTEYYFNGVLGMKTEAKDVAFGTPTVTKADATTSHDMNDGRGSVTYALDRVENKNLVVSADESENVARVYYATDMIGEEDATTSDGVPDKYQATITFTHEGCECGTETDPRSVVVTFYDESGSYAAKSGKATLSADRIPALTETEGWVVDEEQTNWPEGDLVIESDEMGNVDRTFNVRHKLGSFGYEVRYVNEADEPIAEASEGKALYGASLAEDALAPKVIEGYALDTVEGADRAIGVEASQNVVTLRYAVDKLGGAAGVVGDGVPDKYQAAVTYRAEHGVFDALVPASREVIAAVSLKQKSDEGVWADVDAASLNRQIPLTGRPDEGYVAGGWDVDPTTANLEAGEAYTFTYAFAKGQFGYRVNYYRGTIADENLIESKIGTATFEDPIPWSNGNCPVGFVKDVDVAAKAISANVDENVLDVVYPRAYFTVRGVLVGAGSIEGNPNQNLAYGNSSTSMVFNAAEGYRIASIVVNGESQEMAPGITSFDFGSVKRVTQNITVEVRTVAMGAVAVVAPSFSRVYDGTALKAGAAQISGVPEGFTAEATVVGEQVGAGTSAAAVDRSSIVIRDDAGKDVTKNFQIEVIDGALNVDRAPVTVTVAHMRKMAGTEDPVFEGTVEGLVEGDKLGNMEYVRTVEGEQPGVYLDALSARFDYNANYEVTIIPGTFTIASAAALTPGTASGDSTTPAGSTVASPDQRGSVSTIGSVAAARQLLAAARPAGVSDLSEPVYADVIGDDTTPMVTRRGGEAIEDDATALGAFDEPHCWVHWVMAFGMLLTVAYAAVVVLRRLGFARKVDHLDDSLYGGRVIEEDRSQAATRHVGA